MKLMQIQDVSFEELLLAIKDIVQKCISDQSVKSSPPLLTRKELKLKYGLSYSTISRYISRGLLVPNRIGGKVFFEQEQIDQAIKKQINNK